MSGKDVYLKTVYSEDIERLIDIHVHSLPGDVLPNLGRATINRYYSEVLKFQSERKAVLFGAYQEFRIIGFCCLTTSSVGIFSLVRVDTIGNLASMLFRKPALLVNALVQLWHATSIPDSACEIAYIGVEDRFRGIGIGGLLINRCMAYCREQGFLYLQTKTSNERLCEYYLTSYGGTIVKEFRIFGDAYRLIRWRV